MTLTLDGFLLFAGTVVAIGWLAVGLGRLATAWAAAESRGKDLRRQQVATAKELLRNAEELEQLKQEATDAKQKIEALRAQRTAKQKEVATFVPPQAPEILVTSEYPPAKGDKAFTVTMARTGVSRTKKGPDTPLLPAHKYYLVWGGDHTAALARARQLLAGEDDYEVNGGHRFG